jgi:hypothetical protein
VRETKAMRETLLPVFDAMYADAVAACDDIDTRGRSLIARLRVVIPMLFRPEGAPFRDKYGSLPQTALSLTFRLTNDFLPRSPRDSRV